ncbi:MAG: ABC transporter ATP-binding protein, partial [Chloroflexi bacterium]|nr:ABC transporter ATP-binding protein [Chloroflexota bacterium]
MIQLDQVTYTYPQAKHPALSDISLEITESSLVAIVGPSGAGKSSLCALLAGFIPHHFHGTLQGRALVQGQDIAKTPLAELVTHVGLVFQNPFTQLSGAKLTTREEIAFGLENLGVPRLEMAERVARVIELFGLRDIADRSPYALSGGEMQRVALASIFVMEPRVLVLDEPTAQLDPLGARQVFEAIRTLANTQSVTVIIVEDKTEWIATFADRVITLHEGRVVLDGSPNTVLTSPLLDEIGIRVSHYTQAARAASRHRLWPSELALPTTLDKAIDGFKRARKKY